MQTAGEWRQQQELGRRFTSVMVAFAAWYYVYFIYEVPPSCNLRPAPTWQTSDNPNTRVPVAALAHTLAASACQGPGWSPDVGAPPEWRGVSPGPPSFPKSWAMQSRPAGTAQSLSVGLLRLPRAALVLREGILGLLPLLDEQVQNKQTTGL